MQKEKILVVDDEKNICDLLRMYLEKEGFAPGAYQDVSSPYREFFRFTDEKPGYEAWWDVETLPKLNYENSRKLWDTIFSAVQKWLAPPYCIDGWRLDVADELPHEFLGQARPLVRRARGWSRRSEGRPLPSEAR